MRYLGPGSAAVLLCLGWAGGSRGLARAAEQRPPPPTRIDARMVREPAVSATQIAFVYAGDIWIVPKTGGLATRLSSPRGEEEFPRFSPDGSLLAFSGNYDGNVDLYVMPVTGGVPRRLTHHGAPDRLLDWYPDGQALLFASSMTSPRDRFNQLFKVPITGGLPERLPVPYGEFGAISPDGQTLAYTPISVDFRTWKRYRGGMNPDIWFFNLRQLTARNITHSAAADSQPMWHGDTLYFLSDRDEAKRDNIWAYDLKTDRFRQVTKFTEFDVHFPSIGPTDLVFENAGQLFLLDLATEHYHAIEVRVATDRATLKPRLENVSAWIHSASVSPSGKRALFEARGDVFSAPAEHGVIRNLTRTSGVAERFPTWSPDAQWIAYFSDRTGEYELTLRPADGTGAEETLTHLGPGFRYRPQWAPDSQKLAFIDKAMRLHLYHRGTKTDRVIDHQLWFYEGALNAFRVSWSADSRWLAYAGDQDNHHTALVLYDTKLEQRHQVTSGFYNDDLPTFDPEGKYLYLRTRRTFAPLYSELDDTWIYANTANLAVITLRQDLRSPLAPRDDEEGASEKERAPETKAPPTTPGGATNNPPATNAPPTAPPPTHPPKETKKDEKPKPVEIDLDGFEQRLVLLPPKAGRYADLAAVAGKLLYRRLPRLGAREDRSPLVYYELEKREEKTILDDADGFELSANREKLLVRKGSTYAIIEPKEGQKLDKPIDTGAFEALIDPPAEWRQLFTEAWRLERDFFYDPGLHGVDWGRMRTRYGKLLDDAVTRWDVNYIIGELIGELNSSHTYRSGGDLETGPTRGVGYLGVDYALDHGAYRFQTILAGAPWDAATRSPLREPGLRVKAGEYLLAVNGVPLDVSQDPWAAFQDLADKPVMLTINDKPTPAGAREVLVRTLASEARLRYLAWIEANRRRVELASAGRIGYIYVPDTGVNGQNDLVRQWQGQVDKPGLIIDERFNSGGQIPNRFIELLDRPLRNYWAVRDGRDWTWPQIAQFGPKAMLVNGWSGSGGDCFPFYFKESGLGPLIGMRTWGGLIGMTGAPGLIDGGSVTVPTFGIYNLKGRWIIEGHGVDPDIEVVDDPAAMARGGDPQLERAILEVSKQLKQHPPTPPHKPAYPKKPGF